MSEEKTITSLVAPRKKGRSPSYPAIDLRHAVERARVLYETEKRHSAPVTTVIRHWGLSPQSGTGQVNYAALKKFGLVVEDGSGSSRQAQLSDLALRIILDPRPESKDRQSALREAALKPAIHADLWREFGGSLPSDDNLRYQLQLHRGFTETGVEEFIDQFKRTLSFAGLTGEANDNDDDSAGGSASDLLDDNVDRDRTAFSGRPVESTTSDTAGTRLLDIPLSPTRSVLVRMPTSMSSDDWQRMEAILAAMKPAIVMDTG